MPRYVATTVLLTILAANAVSCARPDVDETQRVAASRDSISLPWYISEPVYKQSPRKNSALWPREGTKKRDGSRTFQQVTLENEFLRVEVLPEVGGAVGGVVYKPTGEDIFFREGKAKDWVPYWESGIKANFPWREHCIGTTGQGVGYRVIHREDGSGTIAMWMEFSRHDDPWQSAMYGRFSNLLLSQHVTLRPDVNRFTVTYRITNPTPYRQGLRLWVDALMPRTHTADGVLQGDARPPMPTQTEWIFPARWVSHHRAMKIRRYTPDDDLIRKQTSEHNSIFALDIPYGFAGLWYPQVKVNRLRITDPSKAPGAKQYYRGEGKYRPGGLAAHMYNFCELWGGIDNVMEGVENWIGPGETYEFSHTYTMVKGIGKVDFANRKVAVNVEFGGRNPHLEVVPLRPTEGLRASLDGKALGTVARSGPTKPASFALPADAQAGTITLSDADGHTLLKQAFPLKLPSDPSRHEEIKQFSDLASAEGAEKLGDQMDFGRTIEKAMGRYPANSLGRGRIQYRLGHLDHAIATLTGFTRDHPTIGEGWHLLGVAYLEKGKSADASKHLRKALAAGKPYHPALHYLAIQDIADGRAGKAIDRLETLVEKIPAHWEGRLLLAWLHAPSRPSDALNAARKLVAEDPGDPRALRVLLRAATQAQNAPLARKASAGLEQILREQGAKRRLKEFLSSTRGEYVHPNRLKGF